jgi:hypothetical protein
MTDNKPLPLDGDSYADSYAAGKPTKPKAREADGEEASCKAFGYLRGLQERALAVRFCFRSGNSICLPYSWLGPWEHNPSAGLLAKFSGDAALLLLIRGSNLDALVAGSVNLTDRGLQRHRIVWVREMDEDELRRAGEGEPTVDRIQIKAFVSQEKMREWVKLTAPAFAEGPLVAV